MMRQKKVELVEIQRLGNLLGLSRADLDALLLKRSLEQESIDLSLGPPRYGSGFYGAVSIYDLWVENEVSKVIWRLKAKTI